MSTNNYIPFVEYDIWKMEKEGKDTTKARKQYFVEWQKTKRLLDSLKNSKVPIFKIKGETNLNLALDKLEEIFPFFDKHVNHRSFDSDYMSFMETKQYFATEEIQAEYLYLYNYANIVHAILRDNLDRIYFDVFKKETLKASFEEVKNLLFRLEYIQEYVDIENNRINHRHELTIKIQFLEGILSGRIKSEMRIDKIEHFLAG